MPRRRLNVTENKIATAIIEMQKTMNKLIEMDRLQFEALNNLTKALEATIGGIRKILKGGSI